MKQELEQSVESHTQQGVGLQVVSRDDSSVCVGVCVCVCVCVKGASM